MADLDEIMSGGGEPAPTPDVQTQAPAQEPQQAQVQEPQDRDEDDEEAGLHKARDAERAKSRRYKEELAEVSRRLQATEQQNAAILQTLAAQAQPRPTPQPPQPKKFWDAEDPDVYLGETVDTRVQSGLAPLQQALMVNAHLIANAIHTPEKVAEAERAFLAAKDNRQLTESEFNAVVGSPNRFHAAVEWFNNRPETQRERLEAEILAKYGITPGQTPQAPQPQPTAAQPPVMPTSFAGTRSAGPRTAPGWSGPKPLSELMPR